MALELRLIDHLHLVVRMEVAAALDATAASRLAAVGCSAGQMAPWVTPEASTA